MISCIKNNFLGSHTTLKNRQSLSGCCIFLWKQASDRILWYHKTKRILLCLIGLQAVLWIDLNTRWNLIQNTYQDSWSYLQFCLRYIFKKGKVNECRTTLVNNLIKESFYRKKKKINVLTAFFISHKNDVKTFIKWIFNQCYTTLVNITHIKIMRVENLYLWSI